jgi:tetratricopeptide (TPR) repeat protein
MKKQIVLITLMALLIGLFAMSAAAQMTTQVKGFAKDENGKPMVDCQVIMQSTDSGRKYTLKTDKKGEFFSLGIQPGTYNFSLMKDGKPVWQLNGMQITLSGENVVSFDMAKEKAAAAKASGISEEEQKKIEAAQKENVKIKGLNEKLNAARQAREAGNVDQAIQLLQEATQMDSTRDILWASLADAYSAGQKYPEAIDAYQKAIAIAPNKGEYHNNLGQAYLKSNQIDQAIAEYNKAAELDPTNAGTYYFNLGAVLTNKNKLDEANAAFDKAIAADPNKADAYYWKGVNQFAKATVDKSGKLIAPEGTAELLNKYLELAPEGKMAQPAKDLLASMGAQVETTFGKQKPAKKK